nr:thioredoxin family protein [Staphylococcus lugdunensis]
MIQLESEQQFDKLKQSNVVFEFTAGWCPDCKIIEPDLPILEHKYPQFQFVSVDRD